MPYRWKSTFHQLSRSQPESSSIAKRLPHSTYKQQTSTFTKNSYRWRPQLLPLEVILPPEAPNDNADEYTLELQGVDRIFLIWPDWKWLSWKSTEEKNGNGDGLGLDFKCMNYTTFSPKLDSNSIRNVESCLTHHPIALELNSNVILSLYDFILISEYFFTAKTDTWTWSSDK